ncbi:MAG: alpha/beta fold hydrolase, partial [Dehalococcoidia bacterium]|nr:alpha/beta fold hydrolase [Dehalococcoidia bacterium]
MVFVPAWVHSIDASGLVGESAAIAEGFRVVQYDKQGTGLSGRTLDFDAGFERHADEVIELLDHLRIEQAARIGRSQSGPVVLDAAARFPERVSRVVV